MSCFWICMQHHLPSNCASCFFPAFHALCVSMPSFLLSCNVHIWLPATWMTIEFCVCVCVCVLYFSFLAGHPLSARMCCVKLCLATCTPCPQILHLAERILAEVSRVRRLKACGHVAPMCAQSSVKWLSHPQFMCRPLDPSNKSDSWLWRWSSPCLWSCLCVHVGSGRFSWTISSSWIWMPWYDNSLKETVKAHQAAAAAAADQ